MVPCLAAGEGAEGSVEIIAVVEGTLAAMGIVVVVSALREQREPEKPGAQVKLSKSDMRWEPEMLRELEKLCESWELPESKKQREPKTQGKPKKQGRPKKQGKPKYLWEPWERLKPLEPGVQVVR
jgi:hypothetical protein